jgi:tetratricopeptide (TPR) repeat protein
MSDLRSQAIALHNAGRFEEAKAIYQTLLATTPDDPSLLNLMGNLSFQQGQWKEGITWMDKVIKLKPDYPNAHYDRALAYMKMGNSKEALSGFKNALNHDPHYTDALINCANALQSMNHYEDALVYYDDAIKLKPELANIYSGKGKALHELKRFDEAFENYDKAIALAPDNSQAYLNKAMLKLSLGQFEEGWLLYEWRWKKSRKDEGVLLDKPLWRGESIHGKTILLYSEQGFGDTIQCCRYVPFVEALGAKVILKVRPQLKELISTLKASYELVSDEFAGDFDTHCPLFSLPLAFKTNEQTIPNNIPYLFATPAKIKAVKEKLGNKDKPRIGLVWAGSVTNTKDNNRNLPVNLVLSLLHENYEFHCLQQEIKAADKALLKQHNHIIPHTHQLHDFSDTAALIANMDLVITVDTSVAHLAGALGKPVWIMLPFVPDFRWMTERQDSPWYPNARLFRQGTMGEWKPVIENISIALKAANF